MNVPGKLTKGKDLKDKTAKRETDRQRERAGKIGRLDDSNQRERHIMSRNLLIMYLLTALFICSHCQ